MGFLLSKAATQTSAVLVDSKVNDHLVQGAEKSGLEPVTRLFQNTNKIKLEDAGHENCMRGEGTDTGWNSMGYVKENDGLVVTDLE
ncbi:uncharacterized protein C2orf15 homolog [Alexandromys fortis]|uniref:uncharacterized protein C2orf15 homolog n=1 Tax=Alexandromys fortis TaxID=100897 RepID=UPI00215291A3|nr:uncharacterized protein C2orf15 homolog [Microtus fortis]XP_049990750.1 uncharacterized protein C2orf15 homolog [Microtus fortis]XP_049990751.1 uncharacterized protein C2orf15 homolog [Microtus fortis]XP_049990753.1 uncharacterized protein C2orf15 homolog [Microtus fortis]XP_049990754.1 uncharacterized protein C2orf15 homolog [Microtus fortis]XP_049990755.1 uncharacterized protein C2orf15 homolog [Microtus fortis]XP_049990756.1 uncharacterized protein C2orf15 homolog [Microtus fortis]XP_0